MYLDYRECDYRMEQVRRMQEEYERVMLRARITEQEAKERERQMQQDTFIQVKRLKDENSKLKQELQKLEEKAAAVSEF